jgi:hypothetical protein
MSQHIAVVFLNAIQALKLRRHWLETCGDGVLVHQPGKPTLTLSYEHAKAFDQQLQEANND